MVIGVVLRATMSTMPLEKSATGVSCQKAQLQPQPLDPTSSDHLPATATAQVERSMAWAQEVVAATAVTATAAAARASAAQGARGGHHNQAKTATGSACSAGM